MNAIRDTVGIRAQGELAILGVDRFFVVQINGLVVQCSIVDKVGNGTYPNTVFFSKLHQFRSTGHCSVFIHDLNDYSSGFVTR